MKYLLIVIFMVSTFCAGNVSAQDDSVASASDVADNVAAAGSAEKKLKPIELSNDSIPVGNEDVDSVGTMPVGQSYDDNTGMPNVTSSDSSMELN